VGGQAAEQIIAGVVLSERLAVTMYGAIHRAQFNGQRNLRGLVVDPKILAEETFRDTLTDATLLESVTALEHQNIVPTFTVESGGSDVVVVTRGSGRYVTVQDLITAARSRAKSGGKLSTPVAGLIGKSVIEALAAAHQAGVIHGAVHPRSVLIDEDGTIRLGDFVVGRALTTAVAQGADSSLWRGLTGYIAPELVVGEEPAPVSDVFAVGAMLFTMLSGEAPPGVLRVTPAVERLVQRALDTDPKRRYKTATDLLENLIEAMEDDRWELADRDELIKVAGLSQVDENIDDATEDLLASLGSAAVQVTPQRVSMDLRAEQAARRQSSPGVQQQQTGGRLDALLADLGNDHTSVSVPDDEPYRRDPISELISLDPRKRDAIQQSATRVPSLDDPDEDDSTPLPPPARDLDYQAPPRRSPRAQSSPAGLRPGSSDEAAALAAIGDLDDGVRRVSNAGDQASIAAQKLEEAAARAERAAQSLETGQRNQLARPVAAPVPDLHIELDAPSMRVKSRMGGVLGVIVIAVALGAIYMIYQTFTKQDEINAQDKVQAAAIKEKHDKDTLNAIADLPDPGSIKVTSDPAQAGVWLKIGRTPVDSIGLESSMMHELRVEGIDGYDPVDTQVVPTHWSAPVAGQKARKASITVVLKPATKDQSGKPAPIKLPVMPPKPPDATGFTPGRGPIHVESTPSNAEVWMYIGMTNNVELQGIRAGMPYELRVLADGYLPGYVTVTADDWRDGGDPNTPIDRAKKKATLAKALTLEKDPNATAGSGDAPRTPGKKDGKKKGH